jgi:hypothetical protein
MINSRNGAEEPNKESSVDFLLPDLIAAAFPKELSDEAFHAVAIAIFESEGGLILTGDGI